ncbi:MAG: HNH endonuclease [Gammaproteobacteria bacterium]
MPKVGEIITASNARNSLLDTVMEGGDQWHSFLKTGTCKRHCPGYNYCNGSGPGGRICSDAWYAAEANPLVISVLRHVLENYDYYDRGDFEHPEKEKIASELLVELGEYVAKEADTIYTEGGELLRTHRYRERDSNAAREKKEDALSEGHLKCRGCGTDYLSKYGATLGLRIIECHHTVPLSSEKFDGETKKSTLELLCANCHKLAHSRKDPLTIRELKMLNLHANKMLEPDA